MAETNFELEPKSGTGNSTVKVTPKSSKHLDNIYQEEYNLKVNGKTLDKVRFKIANVHKDRFVPKTSYNLLKYAIGKDGLPDYRDFEKPKSGPLAYLYTKSLKDVRSVNILHSMNIANPNFLNQIREIIWVYDYRVKHFLSLNSLYNYYKEIRKVQLPRDQVAYNEDLILNRAYFGDILIDLSKTYKFGQDLNKGVKGFVYLAPQDKIILRLPKDKITQEGNHSTKPYHIRISWNNRIPPEGIVTGMVKSYKLQNKIQFWDLVRKGAFGQDIHEGPKETNEVLYSISPSFINISCVEEDIDLGYLESSTFAGALQGNLCNNAGENIKKSVGDERNIDYINLYNWYYKNTFIWDNKNDIYPVFEKEKDGEITWEEP